MRPSKGVFLRSNVTSPLFTTLKVPIFQDRPAPFCNVFRLAFAELVKIFEPFGLRKLHVKIPVPRPRVTCQYIFIVQPPQFFQRQDDPFRLLQAVFTRPSKLLSQK